MALETCGSKGNKTGQRTWDLEPMTLIKLCLKAPIHKLLLQNFIPLPRPLLHPPIVLHSPIDLRHANVRDLTTKAGQRKKRGQKERERERERDEANKCRGGESLDFFARDDLK